MKAVNNAADDGRSRVGRYAEGIKSFGKELLAAGAAFFGIQQGIEFVRDSIKDFHGSRSLNSSFRKTSLSNMGREDVMGELRKGVLLKNFLKN